MQSIFLLNNFHLKVLENKEETIVYICASTLFLSIFLLIEMFELFLKININLISFKSKVIVLSA